MESLPTDQPADPHVRGEAFSIVPEWLLDADVSDRAVRLYGVLRRYLGANETVWPSRRLVAQRLRCSLDSIDRALAELVGVDAVRVQKRFREDGGRGSSIYWLWPFVGPADPVTLTDGMVAADVRQGDDAGVRHQERESVGTRVNEKPRRTPTAPTGGEHQTQLIEVDTSAVELAQVMIDALVANGCRVPRGTAERPIPERWIADFDKLLRIDSRPIEEARRVLAWTMADEFEHAVVLSPGKFRARYDGLRLKSQRNGHREPLGLAGVREFLADSGR